MIAGYPHFLKLSQRLQWDAEAIDLRADARAWPRLDEQRRAELLGLLAGFCVGEAVVADELEPFRANAGDGARAACFAAQRRDEERHARFFDRVAEEVAAVPGATAAERRAELRALLDADYLDLFERRLPATAAALAGGAAQLADAVGLYHMVLEGVVFTAGQLALLELLDGDTALPGVRAGVELVVRDERWHVGFGTRCLQDAGIADELAERILRDGEDAARVWTPAFADRAVAIHRRRLGAVRSGAEAQRGDAPAVR